MKNYIIAIIFSFISLLQAEIITDGSVGSQVTLSGPDFTIDQTLGLRVGNNLFHSFKTFSINNQESATFTGAADIVNVISRVTGGEVSTIDGLLKSTIGSADFYFFNPSGIVFGANAVVDVPAAFHVSTADNLKLEDGTIYSATNPSSSSLGIAQPISFGYLNRQATNLTINGTQLTLSPSGDLSISSSNIQISNEAYVETDAGTLNITAVGEQEADLPIGDNSDFVAIGNIEILNGSGVSSTTNSAKNAGDINIQTGNMLIDGTDSLNFTYIQNYTNSEYANAGKININASGSLTIINGQIFNSSSFTGDGGDTLVKAQNLYIDGVGSQYIVGISSQAFDGSSGNSGKITVRVDDQIQLLNTAEISTRTYATGKSGLINVSANNQITLSKGATIFSSTSNAGNAGKVNIKTQGELDISDNSLISSTTFSQGKAGDVTVQAGELLIDGKGTVAGISSASSSQDVDAGESGSIYVTTDSSVNLLNGAQIFNITETTANAGDINIETNALVIDGKGIYTGISNSTTSDSTHAGNAGNINILTDNKIEILEGGRILNDTFSMGKAGNIIIDSAKLLLDGKNIITGITSNTNSDYLNAGNAGTVTITASDQIEILNGAGVSSNTFSTGDAGSVSVEADEILIDANNENMFTGIASDAELSSTGNAGIVNVTSHGLLKVVNGATISSNTFSIGNAGEVRLIAQEIELVGGVTGIFTGISSSADIDSFGNAGTVDITAFDSLDIMNGAAIASSTFSKGNAGDIRVKAGKVLLDGKNATMVTEISSSAEAGSSGDAGEVAIDVDNMLQIISGAAIASSTFSKGNAGSVKVQADEILIDGNKENMFTGIVSNAEVSSTGNAGTLTLKANKIRLIGEGTSLLSGISSSADIDTFGNAGTVDITAIDSLELTNGAAILSSAWSKGNAGDIRVKAGRVLLDGKDATMATTISSSAEASSSGDAGRIDINVANELKVLSGATIGSSTFSKGNAGGVRVQAGDILLDGKDATIATVISSSAESGSSGDAGTVRVNVANALKIFSGAAISSSTWASGDAGEIKINAENIIIDDKNSPYWKTGIGSVALADATGLVGNININTNNLQIFNGGLISISHYGNIADTYLSNSQIGSLSINAHTIDLYNKSQISALATGNAPASSIDIHVSDTLSLKGSSGISTQANTNNGGPINILSANSIILNNSLITTSTDQGDGGNINIDSDLLVMDTGFIQANTAQGASGGDIAMEIKYLITKKSISPEVGGDRQEEFMSNSGRNIIQAAAPQGNPGNLHVNIPDIDIASSLVKLSTHYIKEVDLIKNPCSSNTLDSSSLVEVGKGGVPIEPKDSVNIFFGADRLENLMNN